MLVYEVIHKVNEGPNDPRVKAISCGRSCPRKGFVVKNPMGADSTGLRIVNSDDVYEKLASLAKSESVDPKDPRSGCKSPRTRS